MGKFFNELKRRNVVRVGLAYVVVGWLVFQIGEVLFPVFGTPDWVFKTIILVIAIGLPFALIFAWAFELTSDGVKKTREVDIASSVTANTGRKLDFVIIGALVIALGYFILDRPSEEDHTVENAATSADAVAIDAAATVDALTAGPTKRSIAVIPFVNMSSDQEQEWFADGLTEEILNSLARTPDLLVAARTSSFAFKGSSEGVPAIAKALGVEHVLEGSVRRSGERLRVTAQLIRAHDGFHLWSETYDRTVDDMIDIQENVAIEIANALETALDPEALALMVSAGTSSVPAYEAYLQGLAFGVSQMMTGDKFEMLGAREAFERAIELDPEFSSAYWQLARFWFLQSVGTLQVAGITGLSQEQILLFYEEALDRAIEYEHDQISIASYRAHQAEAQIEITRALRLNTEYLEQRPYDQRAQSRQVVMLAELGKHEAIGQTIANVQARDGYDAQFTLISLTHLRVKDQYSQLRDLANEAMIRFEDNVSIVYQAHRALLWVGDIDGAARLLPQILSSDLDDDSRYLVELRQACAENRLADAQQLYLRGNDLYADELSIVWLGHIIMGNQQAATDTLMPLDDANDMHALRDFLSYASFDASQYKNMSALLLRQDIDRGEVVLPPYQCKR